MPEIRTYFDRHEKRLVELGLRRRRGFVAPHLVAPYVALLTLGVVRVGQGIATGNPVGFLVMMIIGIGIVWPIIAWSKGTAPTRAGQIHLPTLWLRARNNSRADSDRDHVTGQVGHVALFALVLNGPAELHNVPELAALPDQLANVGQPSNSSGCGGGGGGGGGGGCGGCGG